MSRQVCRKISHQMMAEACHGCGSNAAGRLERQCAGTADGCTLPLPASQPLASLQSNKFINFTNSQANPCRKELATWCFERKLATVLIDGETLESKDARPTRCPAHYSSPVEATFIHKGSPIVIPVATIWWGLVSAPRASTSGVVRQPWKNQKSKKALPTSMHPNLFTYVSG
jgi:hypothetical protein